MSKTESLMLPLGTSAPPFSLPDVVSNKVVQYPTADSPKATVLCFICNHCPYVKRINAQLVAVAKAYISKGIRFIAISANDVSSHPDDSPERMRELAAIEGYPFPYLYDESQEVAKAYSAACTPDFFVFNDVNKLVYRGQFDDSRPANDRPVTGESLCKALECLINNTVMDFIQKPSLGCNIKWKES